MNEIIQFLIQHGYTVLFVWVLADQIGLPVPAAPLLLATGALAAERLVPGADVRIENRSIAVLRRA